MTVDASQDSGSLSTPSFGITHGPDQRGWPPRAYLKDMDDKEIMSRISGLIDTEHELRGQLQRGELSSERERERLRSKLKKSA